MYRISDDYHGRVSDIDESGIAVARAVRTAVGGPPTVDRYFDVSNAHWVDVMHWHDRPASGLDTHSTLSLHRTPNLLDGSDIRIEIAGVADSSAAEFVNLLSTAAFFVMKDRWLCAPGVVFPDLIARYYPGLSTSLRHVLFVEPFPWQELSTLSVGPDLDVHWLLAMAISDAERQYLNHHGYDELEALFTRHEVAYFDLRRDSVA